MKNTLIMKIGTLALGAVSFTLCAVATTVSAASQSFPVLTAIPVSFTHTIDAKKAKAGDVVTATTMQTVELPGGGSVAKGSIVEGHVVAADSFHFDTIPYAHQKPSEISIHFDKLRQGDLVIPVNLSVRAIASPNDSFEASYPHSNVDSDPIGEFTLIGGAKYTSFDKIIQSEDGDAIAYNRKGGVFARLIASGSCAATDTEQSIGIFSPDACGAYGLGGGSLLATGRDGSGTFTLALRGHSEKLYAGTTALMQVTEAR